MDNNEHRTLTPEEARALGEIISDFLRSYDACRDKMDIESWLTEALKGPLPTGSTSVFAKLRGLASKAKQKRSPQEAAEIAKDIIETLRSIEEKNASLEKAVANGRSRESWFAKQMEDIAAQIPAEDGAGRMSDFDRKAMAADAVKQITAVSAGNAAEAFSDSGAVSVMDESQIEELSVVRDAVVSDDTFAVAAVAAGAVRTAVDEGRIQIMPKETPTASIAQIAYTNIKNLAIAHKVSEKMLTAEQGVEKMGRAILASTVGVVGSVVKDTLSKAAGIGTAAMAASSGMAAGSTLGWTAAANLGNMIAASTTNPLTAPIMAALGKAVTYSAGAALGPSAAAVGGALAAYVGYKAGKKVFNAIVEHRAKICAAAKTIAQKSWEGIKTAAVAVKAGAEKLASMFSR